MHKKPNTLWGGRFESAPDEIAIEISESISFDIELAQVDIQASKVHAKMLGKQGILPKSSVQNILQGLDKVAQEIKDGKLPLQKELEDIHTHIEKRLTEIIGEDGKRLHTARSRNDQVATDTRLYLKEAILLQKEKLLSLLQTILKRADQHKDDIWAGYTHTQIAQPVSLGHYFMAYFWKFFRDLNLLEFALSETDVSPLGSAALAGANYPIDRQFSAKELGFSRITENSMDAVSERDYQLSYHYFASRLFLHISRLCEDFILYSTAEFSYIRMPDSLTTGSSIMPQKKNPDIAELLRGKSARVVSNFVALMMNLKSLPLTYNRDLQEDKIYLLDSIRQVHLALEGIRQLIQHTEFFPEKVRKNLNKGFAQATDIADYLVREYNIPFREAHDIVGRLVKACEEGQYDLENLPEEKWKSVLPEGIHIPQEVRTVEFAFKSKQGKGSASSQSVEDQMEKAKRELQRFQ